jgi:endonuclease-8
MAREHTRDFSGRRVRVSSPQGRFAKEARRLNGRVFGRAEAWGKHLFHHWEGGLIVHVHLGMFGWFYRRSGSGDAPRPTVRMRLSTPEVMQDLIGPPTCELVTEERRKQIIERLGADPVRSDAGRKRFTDSLARSRGTVGDALLDQRIAAGVGNIYRAEALFLAGLHPLRAASSLPEGLPEDLWRILRDLMLRGVREERTSTVARKDLTREEKLSGTETFYVYQQERCRRCGSRIRRFPLTARVMYACPRCQPRGGGKVRARRQQERRQNDVGRVKRRKMRRDRALRERLGGDDEKRNGYGDL